MLSLNAEKSAKWMEKGNILLHPTEGVWGLGCNPFNLKAVERVFELKQRKKSKKFILLFRNIDSVNKYSNIFLKKEIMSKFWPGHNSVIIPANKLLPEYLIYNKVFIARVSNHLPIISLHNFYSGPFISTSANISGIAAPENLDGIIKLFSCDDVALYNAPLGNKVSSSRIYNLIEKKYVR